MEDTNSESKDSRKSAWLQVKATDDGREVEGLVTWRIIPWLGYVV